jgi:hypothetical protein
VRETGGKRGGQADLQHGVAVSIRDVDLQPSKISVIVVGEVKCFDAEFGILDLHLAVWLGDQ